MHKLNKIAGLLLLLNFPLLIFAWEGMSTPRLHVEGKYLKDPHGNKVILHGFAQTYSPWFNERGTKWTGYDVNGCLTYNKSIIDSILNAGWKMNFLRLHMDPYWSNTPGCTPDGHELPNCFDETRFSTYLDQVFYTYGRICHIQRVVCNHTPSGCLSRSNRRFVINDVFLTNSDSYVPTTPTYNPIIVNPTFSEDIELNMKSNEPVDVYNMMGVRIRTRVKFEEALNGLPHGLYIVGNKKIFKTDNF